MEECLTNFRCRCCRTILFSAEDLDNHASSIAAPCTSWYLKYDSTKWVLAIVQKSQWTAGKLHCPKCKGKVGAFNFLQGITCICGKFVIPVVWVQKSRVDRITPSVVSYISQPKTTTRWLSPKSTYLSFNDADEDDYQQDQRDYDTSGETNDSIINTPCNIKYMECTLRTTHLNRDAKDKNDCQLEPAIIQPCSTSDTLNAMGNTACFSQESENASPKGRHRTDKEFVLSCQSFSHQNVKAQKKGRLRSNQKMNLATAAKGNFDEASEHAINEHSMKNFIPRKKGKMTKITGCYSGGSLHRGCQGTEDKDKQNEKMDDSSDTEVKDCHICPICLDLLYEPCRCQCGHVFCDPCLRELNYRSLFQNIKCPMCRKLVEKHLPDTELRNEIKIMYAKLYRRRHKVEVRSKNRKWPLPTMKKSSFNQPRQATWQTCPYLQNIFHVSLLLLLVFSSLLLNWY